MIIQNDRDKVLLELNDEELIIKRFFKNTHITKENILSAYLRENTLFILCKDNKYTSKNITSINFSQMNTLEVMINELNKKNIIFFPSDMYILNPIACLPLYSSIISTHTWEGFWGKLFSITLSLIFLIGIIIYIKRKNSYTGWVYNIQNKEFQKLDKNNTIIDHANIEDTKIKEGKQSLYFKLVTAKYKLFLPKDIKYPLSYKQIVDEIYISKIK